MKVFSLKCNMKFTHLAGVNMFVLFELAWAIVVMAMALALRINGDDEDTLHFIKSNAEALIKENLEVKGMFQDLIVLDPDDLRRVWKKLSLVVAVWNMADLGLFLYTLTISLCILMGDKIHKMHFQLCVPFSMVLFAAGALRISAISDLDSAVAFHRQQHLRQDAHYHHLKTGLRWMALLEFVGGVLLLSNVAGLGLVMTYGKQAEWHNREGKLYTPLLILLTIEMVLALLPFAFFFLLTEANRASQTIYYFAISNEGKLAAIICLNILYTIASFLGHIWGDKYLITTSSFAIILGLLSIAAGAPVAGLINQHRSRLARKEESGLYGEHPSKKATPEDAHFEAMGTGFGAASIIAGLILFFCGIVDVFCHGDEMIEWTERSDVDSYLELLKQSYAGRLFRGITRTKDIVLGAFIRIYDKWAAENKD